MKKIIVSAALSALLASPAFAQATPMQTQAPYYSSQRAVHGGHAGYAQYGNTRPAYAAGVVIEGNHVLGQDPDPNVRLQLRRDPVSDY
jgi:opacity protein-like surface antigen